MLAHIGLRKHRTGQVRTGVVGHRHIQREHHVAVARGRGLSQDVRIVVQGRRRAARNIGLRNAGYGIALLEGLRGPQLETIGSGALNAREVVVGQSLCQIPGTARRYVRRTGRNGHGNRELQQHAGHDTHAKQGNFHVVAKRSRDGLESLHHGNTSGKQVLTRHEILLRGGNVLGHVEKSLLNDGQTSTEGMPTFEPNLSMAQMNTHAIKPILMKSGMVTYAGILTPGFLGNEAHDFLSQENENVGHETHRDEIRQVDAKLAHLWNPRKLMEKVRFGVCQVILSPYL